MKTLKCIFIFAVVTFLFSCKKVNLPDDQSKQLIGKWKYVTSSGGFGGGEIHTDVTEVEYTKYGKCKRKDKKLFELNKKFKIELSRSIYSTEQVYVIKYDSGSWQSFKIVNDTLYLYDEVYDGYGYTFVRK